MKLLILLIISPLLVVLLVLANNQVYNQDPPGLWQRVREALRDNVIETRDDHVYPEFRTPVYPLDREDMWQRCLEAGWNLDWGLEASDQDAFTLHWIVTTPMIGFKDDFNVEIREHGEGGSSLYIRSASRVGKADFGANARHVRRYLEALRRINRMIE